MSLPVLVSAAASAEHIPGRDDLILYTITSDSALRIFLPVLDSPRTLQLHACLDLFSSLPFSSASTYFDTSNVFWLDRAQVDTVLKHLLKAYTGVDDAQIRLIKDIVEEKWDLFLRVLTDGSVILSAVAVSSFLIFLFSCLNPSREIEH